MHIQDEKLIYWSRLKATIPSLQKWGAVRRNDQIFEVTK